MDSRSYDASKVDHLSIPQCEGSVTSTGTSLSSSKSKTSFQSDRCSVLSCIDETLVDKLGKCMEKIARNGDLYFKQALKDTGRVFEGVSGNTPNISLRSYLHRMLRYIDTGSGSPDWESLSPGVRALISGIVFIDRLVQKNGIVVTSSRIHRLIAISILVALKMNEDAIVDMKFFAALAGISFSELKSLEAEFLTMLDWDLVISENEFRAHIQKWRRHIDSRPLQTA
jgi:Cyclin